MSEHRAWIPRLVPVPHRGGVVMQVEQWEHGTGAQPPVGLYLAAEGFEASIDLALVFPSLGRLLAAHSPVIVKGSPGERHRVSPLAL